MGMIKNYILGLLCVVTCLSCKEWETQKIDVNTYAAKEWQAIDSTEVDLYPTFPNCDTLSQPLAIRQCFENEVYAAFNTAFSTTQFITETEVSDTIWVQFVVDQKGAMCLDTLRMRDALRRDFPKIPELVITSLKSLPEPFPAVKRGIPVRTRFQLPIILEAD